MAGFADDKENSFNNIMENVEDEQLSAVSDNLLSPISNEQPSTPLSTKDEESSTSGIQQSSGSKRKLFDPPMALQSTPSQGGNKW